MSVLSIDFDVEKLIGKLDIIEKTQVPFAANQALKRFGYLFKTELLPNEFRDKFDAPDGTGKPVARTLGAALFKAEGMTLTLSIKKDGGKGLSPGEYLHAALMGGEAVDTSIHSAIQAITKRYPVPAHGNLRSLGAYTQAGDIKPSYAAKVITGLERNYVRRNQPARGERFVETATKGGRGRLKENRVYRIKGNSVTTIFNLFDRRTTLEPIIKYEEFVEKTAKDVLPSILSKELARAMASM